MSAVLHASASTPRGRSATTPAVTPEGSPQRRTKVPLLDEDTGRIRAPTADELKAAIKRNAELGGCAVPAHILDRDAARGFRAGAEYAGLCWLLVASRFSAGEYLPPVNEPWRGTKHQAVSEFFMPTTGVCLVRPSQVELDPTAIAVIKALLQLVKPAVLAVVALRGR